jgi:hypothetical protein
MARARPGNHETPDVNTFPNLLRPGWIGRMELRNRFVMSPMETMYAACTI